MTTDLLKTWADDQDPPVVILENMRHEPVAYIDLSKWYDLPEDPIISTTNNTETYYMFFRSLGFGIYFTYIRKISRD